LIEENPTKANQFLWKLSDVYRYVLSNREQKIVPLKEEMQMIEAYVHLLKERFGEQLSVHNTISTESQDLFIPVLALQNLVENAVKHNIINAQHPLTISIYTDNDWLVLENPFQPKLHTEHSSKLGLKNIQDRYKLLSKKTIDIEQSPEIFRVRLPLLNLT
jgi:two-component system LytT family sensor kinase